MKRKDLMPVVEAAICGAPGSFEKLCETTGKDILYMCIKIMGEWHDGEDAAQEVYIKMQKSIGALKSPDAFCVWRNRIIVNACNDVRRKNMKQKFQDPIEDHLEFLMEDDMDFLPPEYLESESNRQELISIVNGLPEKYRKVILMYYYEGLSQKDIAAVLDTSVDSVEHGLRRARLSIRKKLEKQPGKAVFYGVTALPVLSQALQTEANAIITAEVVEGFLAAGKAASAVSVNNTPSAVGKTSSFFKTVAITTVGVSAVGIAAAILLSNAASPIPSLPIPLAATSASHSAPQLVPQVSLPVEGLEIDQSAQPDGVEEVPVVTASTTVLVPSAQIPATSDVESKPTQAAPQAGIATLKGRLVFKNLAGEVVPEVNFAAGAVVELYDGRTLCAKTSINKDGTYAMAVPVKRKAVYTFKAVLPSRKGLAFTGENTGGTLEINLDTETTTLDMQTLYYTDTQPPAAELGFYRSSDCKTRLDPLYFTFIVSDATDVSCQWEILSSDGVLMFEGKDKEFWIPFSEIPVPDSAHKYFVRATVADAAGNTVNISGEFFVTVEFHVQNS